MIAHGIIPRVAFAAVIAALAIACGACVDQGTDPSYQVDRTLADLHVDAVSETVWRRFDGRYVVDGQKARFGDTVVLRRNAGYLSMFCGNGAYAYMNGGTSDTAFEMNGYWRNALSLAGGRMRLRIVRGLGLTQLMDSTAPVPPQLAVIGAFSDSSAEPQQLFALRYIGPLDAPTRQFLILGHRAGGRNSDYHPVSENTPGMARFAERLGANGVEIDIRLTRDGVPIIFHDDNISTRLVQQGSLIGPVSNYTLDHLRTFATLVRGERISTLREMLDSVLERTTHTFVYLDIKTPDVVQAIAPIHDEYMAKATAMGRTMEIVMGITSEDVMRAFQELPDHQTRPSLNELSPDDARATRSRVWAPRWTQGLLTADIAAMHAEGRRVVVWTLDSPEFIHEYIVNGDLDGVLTNYPAMVAYEYYMYGVK